MNPSALHHCESEDRMQLLGAEIAGSIRPHTLLTLNGELGAGKSVLARSIIRTLGYAGHVKSPTYTLIETYAVSGNAQGIKSIAHLDLYRLSDAQELFYLGIDEVMVANDLIMVEWPGNGDQVLPEPDIRIQIDYVSAGGRSVQIEFVEK